MAKDLEASRAAKAAYMRRWRRDNPARAREIAQAASQKWRAANPEKAYISAKASGDKWRVRHPDAAARAKRRYRARHPGESRRRRAALAGVTAASFDEATLQAALLDYQCGLCTYCFKPLTEARPPTWDHVRALNVGGTHAPGNLALACLSCNSAKQDRSLLEFLPLTGA